MKKTKQILSAFLLTAFALTLMGAKIGDDDLRIGTKTGTDIEIQMGEGRLKWDTATSKMQFSNDSGVSIKDIGAGGAGAAGVNILENADFESGAPPANWTASAGTFIAETVAPGFDSQSGSWDAGATSQTLDSDFKSVPLGLESRSCNLTIQYKYGTGAGGDYKLQVVANTAGLIAEKDIDVSTDWRQDALQFTCPSSDSIKIRIISTLDAGIILVDNATLGKTNFVDVSQTELAAKVYYPPTANCIWNVPSGSAYADFTADADCPSPTVVVSSSSFTVDTTDDDLPTLKLDNMIPARYNIIARFLAHSPNSVSSVGYRISDGIANGTECGISQFNNNKSTVVCTMTFDLTTNQSKTFKMQGNGVAGDIPRIAQILAGESLVWEIIKYPLKSAEAITLETSGGKFKAAHDDTCGFTTVSATFAKLNGDATCGFTESHSGGISSITSALESANNTAGLNIKINRAGTLFLCASGTILSGLATNVATLQLYDNTDAISLSNNRYVGATNNHHAPYFACGQVSFNGPVTKEIIVRGRSGNGVNTVGFVVPIAGDNEVDWQGFFIDEQFPTPAFTDLTNSLNKKVENNSGLQTKLESCDVFNGAAPVISDNSGLCYWITAATPVGTGRVDYTIAGGTWPVSIPVCECTAANAATDKSCIIETLSTTNIRLRTEQMNSGADVDSDAKIICHGQK